MTVILMQVITMKTDIIQSKFENETELNIVKLLSIVKTLFEIGSCCSRA